MDTPQIAPALPDWFWEQEAFRELYVQQVAQAFGVPPEYIYTKETTVGEKMTDYISELHEKYSQPAKPIETEQWLSMLYSGEFSHADIASLLAERDRLQAQYKDLEDRSIDLGNQYWALMYPDDPTGWEYSTQPFVHIREYVKELQGRYEKAENMLKLYQRSWRKWLNNYIETHPDCPYLIPDSDDNDLTYVIERCEKAEAEVAKYKEVLEKATNEIADKALKLAKVQLSTGFIACERCGGLGYFRDRNNSYLGRCDDCDGTGSVFGEDSDG